MRGFGFYYGSAKRNQPVKLSDPQPVPDHGRTAIESGDAGRDGFTVLSRAEKDCQGQAPVVAGDLGPVYLGPSQDFEQ